MRPSAGSIATVGRAGSTRTATQTAGAPQSTSLRTVWASAPRPTRLFALLMPLVLLAVYLQSPVISSLDSAFTLRTAASLALTHDFALNEYLPASAVPSHYQLEVGEKDRVLERYPQLTALAVAPGLWVLAKAGIDVQASVVNPTHGLPLERTAASLLTLAAVLLFGVFVARLSGRLDVAVVGSLVLALGSSFWSSSSRGLWSHSPSALTLLLCVLFMTLRPSPRNVALIGAAAGLSYIARPSNLPVVLVVGLWLLVRRPRLLHWAMLGGALPLALFVYHSVEVVGTVVPDYYRPGGVAGLRMPDLEALAGPLVSPSRGLFVFTPWLLLLPWGAWRWWQDGWPRDVLLAVLALAGAQWVIISSCTCGWWGGYSYGPRLFTDVVPLLLLLVLVPAVAPLVSLHGRPTAGPLRAVGAAIGLVLVSASVFLHGLGAASYAAAEWNPARGVNLSTDPLWSLRHPQFLAPWQTMPSRPLAGP